MSGLGLTFLRRGNLAHPTAGSDYILSENRGDPEVFRILMSKGVSSDGVGITREDAEKVTSIGTWFNRNTAIESFDEFGLFENAQSLSTRAFYGCTSLKTIDLSKVTKLGGADFKKNTSLAIVVDMPNLTGVVPYGAFEGSAITGIENLGNITTIQGNKDINIGGWGSHFAFAKCVNLKYAKFPATITEFYPTVFGGCTSLQDIAFADKNSIKKIGATAFRSVPANLDIDFPNLETIGWGAFDESGVVKITSLGKITALKGVENSNDGLSGWMNYGVFMNCTQLAEVNLPSTLSEIGYGAFAKCTALSTINLHKESITSIGFCAFMNVPAQMELDFPNLTSLGTAAFMGSGVVSVKNLGSITTLEGSEGYPISGGYDYQRGVFKNCKSLKEVTLPSTLTSIKVGAFLGCTALTTVVMNGTTPPSLNSNAFQNTNSTFVIYVPDESVEAYKAASGWSAYASRIKPLSELNG